MTRPVRRAPVAAVVAATVVGLGCVKTVRDVRDDVVSTRPAPVRGGPRLTMRTEYAPLVDGEIGLRFEGDLPCTARFLEEYTTTTKTHRAHTRLGWYAYAASAGLAVAGIGTGLGLGLDGIRRDNLAANVSLSYGIYLLAGTGVAFAFNALRVGDREKTEGPFVRSRHEDLRECGPGPVGGAAVSISLGGGSVERLTGGAGELRFAPFDLVDAFAPASADLVFSVALRRAGLGVQKFDVGLSAAVLAAAADRFITVRRLRPGGAPAGPAVAPATVAAPLPLDVSLVLSGADAGPIHAAAPATFTARVRNVGARPLDDLRLVTASSVAGWSGRYLYVGALAPGAEAMVTVPLAAGALAPGSTASVSVEALARSGAGPAGSASALVVEAPAAGPAAPASAPIAAPAGPPAPGEVRP